MDLRIVPRSQATQEVDEAELWSRLVRRIRERHERAIVIENQFDGARATYARTVAQRDHSVALDWARSIQDEKRRTESVTNVFQMWRMKDPTAAEAALATAGLTPDQLKQIREIPPQAPGVTATPMRSYGK